MARKTRRRRRQREAKRAPAPPPTRQEGWIGRRAGLWIISLISLALGLFMGAQIMPVSGFQIAVLWSLGAAFSIWLAFFLTLYVTAWIRKRRG